MAAKIVSIGLRAARAAWLKENRTFRIMPSRDRAKAE